MKTFCNVSTWMTDFYSMYDVDVLIVYECLLKCQDKL